MSQTTVKIHFFDEADGFTAYAEANPQIEVLDMGIINDQDKKNMTEAFHLTQAVVEGKNSFLAEKI